MYRAHVRPWIYTWGATEPEITAELPGDEHVATEAPRTTRAVTIDASIESVWPWLAQIGEDRAGFYGYPLLERAVGARIHNADSIHPDWQDLAVGDTVWLARRYGETGRSSPRHSWCWCHLRTSRGCSAGNRPAVPGPSICAERAAGRACWSGAVGRGRTRPVRHPHFLMEQKMLRGIRDRAQDEAAKGRAEATVRQLPGQRIAAPG